MKRDDILIEASELLTKLDDPNIRLYDATILFFSGDTNVTAYDQYLEGHIPGAGFFDHDKFSDSNSDYMYMALSEAELASRIGDIGISQDSEVILYTSEILACATRAWWMLRYAGHNNVKVLNGGLSAWKAVGGEVEYTPSEYEPTSFECHIRPEMFANKEDVIIATTDHTVNLEYTLDVEAYGGAYIPGSSFLPASKLMKEIDYFLSDSDIKSHLKINDQHKRTITYCGGGIAATVNAIAHLMTGNKEIAVYDGSLSEWMGEGLPIKNISDSPIAQ